MKRLFLAVKRKGMSFHAQHGLPVEATEDEFLAMEDVAKVIENAKLFGDKVNLMEDNPDPKGRHWLIRELV